MIEKPPSAELRPDQKDADSLPPYSVLDPILEGYVEEDLSIAELVAAGFDRETVVRGRGLVDRSEYKRRQAPPGVRVSPKAFGKDRRLPITNRWPRVAVIGRLRPYLPELALALAALLYGSTFVLVQDALDDVTPSGFNVLRFGDCRDRVDSARGPPGLARSGPGADRLACELCSSSGSRSGSSAIVAYQTQNVGLEHTSTSNSAFITGLVRGLHARARGDPLPTEAHGGESWSRSALALVGLFLLTGADRSTSGSATASP